MQLVCVCARVYTYIFTCVHADVCVCTYVRADVCVCVFQGDCTLTHLALAANGLNDQSVRTFTR